MVLPLERQVTNLSRNGFMKNDVFIKKVNISEYRFERKFFISGLSRTELEMIIKLHPYNFSEIYQQRNINNIYYDNFDFQCYNDNVIGISNRIKARLRWYGNLFGEINHSKIELKIKKGLLGKNYAIL